jgi:F-type H+-transporting ATPase subunit delta
MSQIDERELAVARVYSRAMLDLAEARGRAETLLEELDELIAVLDSHPAIEEYLSRPAVALQDRRRVVEDLLRGKLSDLAVDSLQVICGKERLGLLRSITEAYRLDLEELRGEVEVHVQTAVPLTDRLRDELRATAAGISGKQVQLIETVNESLIAGLVLRIGDEKVDASAAKQLRQLSTQLQERASQEIQSGRAFAETGVE